MCVSVDDADGKRSSLNAIFGCGSSMWRLREARGDPHHINAGRQEALLNIAR